jgi:hypothetical protein
MSAVKSVVAVVALLATAIVARNDDLFNYGMDTIDNNFGQPEWGDVTCSDLDECVSFLSF